ncbi:TlpA family protein disulfide reductase [Pedobacter xixiisoli]|uniref:Thiol-disulfide isomerase or thioredoxin n=1 Tax=Pedobacter xixiisoli TaxID=1476464 RepID=A0A285ZZ14_9SPHI|nr:TlpA disulfide reductase family protein [Pedobacter xixiisoli]SOD14857.1 Thiol-disulfide isomerase or thioredoxin [Pedobacter xixiisoli]
MTNLKVFILASTLFLFVKAYGQELVKVEPAQPQAGEVLTVTFNQKGSKIPDTVKKLFINFTYSNFYEMPNRLPMQKVNGLWNVSFKLPFYSKYGSFTISDVNKDFVQQPTDTSHYEFFVYKDGKLIEGNYLAKGYSLSAQNRKSPTYEQQQLAWFKKELTLYPENYESQLRILAYDMKKSKGKAKWDAREKALAVIEKKFRSNPTFGGNINSTTMGFLIIGENQKVDSIRQVVAKDFPNSSYAKEHNLSKFLQTKNEVLVVDSLQKLLKTVKNEDEKSYTSAHNYLFRYYIRKKDKINALAHYRYTIKADTSPYRWRDYNNHVKFLESNDMLLDSAKKLNAYILKNVDKYPTSVIRFFPETGYLIGFDEKKAENLKQAESELKAMQGILSYKLGDKAEALKWLGEVRTTLQSKELLLKVADVYKSMGDKAATTEMLGNAYKLTPFDSATTTLLKESILANGGTEADVKTKLLVLDKEWKASHFNSLKKIVLDKNFPDFQIVDMNKKPLTAADLKGKIVLIDLWATWCKPCIEFFPYLQVIYNKYKDDKDVMFVILNTASGNTFEDASTWVNQNKNFTFPFYFNEDKKLNAKLDVNTIPTTFLLDKNGKIRFKKVGNEGEKAMPQLDAMIEFLKQQK